MSGKSRLDYLVSSESERQARYGGWCYKLCAVLSSLFGIAMLVTSFLLFANPRLQIQNYLGPTPVYYYEIFPTVPLGCAAATTVGSMLQIISSLMLLFEDVTLNVWKWLKFTILMISSISIMLLMGEGDKFGEMSILNAYFIILNINNAFCMGLLVCDLCCCVRIQRNTTRPY